jgi:hypothetical protein
MSGASFDRNGQQARQNGGGCMYELNMIALRIECASEACGSATLAGRLQ